VPISTVLAGGGMAVEANFNDGKKYGFLNFFWLRGVEDMEEFLLY
jgi:hypothetical protein